MQRTPSSKEDAIRVISDSIFKVVDYKLREFERKSKNNKKGADGADGEKGEKGDTGATPVITIGTVTTGEQGTQADATITGTAENPVLNLVIPKGEPSEGSILFNEEQALTQAQQAQARTNIGAITPLDVMPVGYVYMSLNNTSPASLFGGTWEAISGRFLLGADSGHLVGTTGGEEKHTLTVAEMPSHTHPFWTHNDDYNNSGGGGGGLATDGTNNWVQQTNNTYIRNEGGSQPHNNMPPYLAVYMWKRTA